MSSVLMDDLKRKISITATGIDPYNYEAVGLYKDAVRWNNWMFSLFSVIVGFTAFLFMGYYMQTSLKNSEFYFSTFLSLLFTGLFIGIILWGVKATFTYSIWRGVIMRNDDRDMFFPFFTIEGMSEISYLLFLPIFLLVHLFFGTYMSGLVLGGAIVFKYLLMYFTYPVFLKHATSADKAILMVSSIGSLIFLYALITVLFL